MSKKQNKLALALVVGVGATLTVLLGISGASVIAADCESSDDNATCVDGNIALGDASCALFSTPNGEDKEWIGKDNSSSDLDDFVATTSFGTYLNITRVSSPAVILGSVIKGGSAYNIYYGAVLNGLNAPLNDGGQEAEISHWTVCWYYPDVTTSTGQVTTSTAPETTTSEAVTSTVPEQTTTTASTSTSLVVDNTTTTTEASTTTAAETTTSTSTPEAASTTTEQGTTTTESETSTSEVSDTTVSAPSSTTTADAETTTTDEAGSETLPRTGPSSSLLLFLLGTGFVGLGYSLIAITKNSPKLTD